MAAITQQYANALWGKRRTFSDKSITLLPDVPPERTYRLPAEATRWVLAAESTRLTLPAEETTLILEAD